MPFATPATITQLAVDRWNTAHSPRLAELMTSLIKHIHDFARETKLTHDEWLAATEYVAALGQISDDKRKEVILASDVIGLSMLVVMLNNQTPPGATPNTVLGPFHIDGSPTLDNEGNLAPDIPGRRLYVSGTVRGLDGEPVADAVLDVWQADEEGMYESQLGVEDARLRALLRTDEEGHYGFWTIAPKGYSIPMDGPVGDLLHQTNISHFRPAHVHFLITAPGYKTVITHLFQRGAEYIDNDVVFGSVEELVTPFVWHESSTESDDHSAGGHFSVNYEFVLAPDE